MASNGGHAMNRYFLRAAAICLVAFSVAVPKTVAAVKLPRDARSTESPASKPATNNFARQTDKSTKNSVTVASPSAKKASAQPETRTNKNTEVVGDYAYISLENTGVGASVRVELDGEEVAILYSGRNALVKVSAGPHKLRVIDIEQSRDKLPNWRDFDLEFDVARFEVLTIRLARGESEREAMQIALMHETTLLRSVAVPAR